MDKRKLRKLADFLKTVPARSFVMTNWQARRASKPEGDAPGDCGFAGCAMGWAAHARLFRGLMLRPGAGVIRFKGCGGFDAAKELFKIDWLEAKHLFSPEYYDKPPTPKQVSKRIYELVEKGGL